MYFEASGIDLRTEFWRVPECPEYRHKITYKDGRYVDLSKEGDQE